MLDVFYSGIKPGLFAHERAADSIQHAQQLSRTRYFWWTNYLTDYSNFDFLFEPVPWQSHQRHAWPSQWHKDSGTYLVPKNGYTETNYRTNISLIRLPHKHWNGATEGFDTSWHPDYADPPLIYQFGTQHQRTGGPRYCVPGATEVKFVGQITSRVNCVATAVCEIDHLDGNAGHVPNTSKHVRYFDNYRDTLIRIANSLYSLHEYVWICSSICDYADFDFSWHPDQWQATILHVFPSNEQKFGDTFFMHVPSFAALAEKTALLEWYDVNYVDISVPRRPMPVIRHIGDSHVDSVKTAEWAGPLAVFTTNGLPATLPTVSLWQQKVKTIMSLSPGASVVIVPKNAQAEVNTQLYDYSYIDKTQNKRHTDQPLDIVFISNGESNADANLAHLNDSICNLNNQLHRVDRVNGRAAAYHAAARASTTAWFFAVFAKLEVHRGFDWNWQPDRMQQAKHYIFHAVNPVNRLEYGHQALVVYNRQLVLDNPGVGLDFTLDSPHQVIPVSSGHARYNTSAWSTWRTAFREVLKLKHSLPDIENEYRLEQWLDYKNTGAEYQKWSEWGAADALEYYDKVDGNFAELRKSYEWSWLATYAFMKRSLTTDQ